MKFVQSAIKSLSVIALLAGFSFSNLAVSESLEERIKPVGETCMAGDPCAAAAVSGSAGAAPRDGKTVYETKCFICHATGAAGAPKLGDAADWSARLSARTLDGLYDSGINGFNGMPAKGTCMDCTDDEIKAAVDHILVESK